MSETHSISQELRILAESIMRQSMKGILAFARDRNISLSQLAVLVHLYEKEKSTVSDIGKELRITSAAASQLIKKLEQDHLVKRLEGTVDRRVREIELANQGRELVDALIESRFRWLDELSLMIDKEKTDQILLAIHELTHAMRQVDPQVVPSGLFRRKPG